MHDWAHTVEGVQQTQSDRDGKWCLKSSSYRESASFGHGAADQANVKESYDDDDEDDEEKHNRETNMSADWIAMCYCASIAQVTLSDPKKKKRK